MDKRQIRIGLIAGNLSANSAHRTLQLARALQPAYTVKIYGFVNAQGIWEPFVAQDIPILAIPMRNWPYFIYAAWSLVKSINADIIIACKPRITSFGIALLIKWLNKTPIILDVDDDEIAMTRPPSSAKIFTVIKYNLVHPSAYWSTLLMHKLRGYADATFSVSKYFQRIYGGVIVPHGRNPEEFDPLKYDGKAIRKYYGIEEYFVVVFMGTPRPHKGIDLLLEAIKTSRIDQVRVLLVGANEEDKYLSSLKNSYTSFLITIPPQPINCIPKFLAAGDAVVLAQSPSPEAFGQMPAKMTDAMFMGLPIIATRLSDIPHYLEDRGILIEEPNTMTLTESLNWLLSHPKERRVFGQNARSYALQFLTYSSMLQKMKPIIEKLIKNK